MIFSEDHIEQIKAETKTQTRRASDRYQMWKFYAIQPCRTCKGIKEGKILITGKRLEFRASPEIPVSLLILPDEAKAEGGYSPEEYEELYEKMHQGWTERYAYLFKYFPTRAIEMMERGEFPMFMLESAKSKERRT